MEDAPEDAPRGSEPASDLARMLGLLVRLEHALGRQEPLGLAAIDTIGEGVEATRVELRRQENTDDARICRLLLRHLRAGRDEIEDDL